MALLEIVNGPSPWDMMLAGFDKHPAGMQGMRTLRFELRGGRAFSGELLKIDFPPYPSDRHWILTCDISGRTPPGYWHETRQVEIWYRPVGGKRQGHVELDLLSPCHYVPINGSREDGVMIGSCETCGKWVTRVNPETGEAEWLDDKGPFTTERLTSIGYLHEDGHCTS